MNCPDNPFDFFDKIYCINLKERKDRWDKCIDNFAQYDINFYTRIDGVKISEQDFPFLNQKEKSQLGCSLSFYKIIKNAYEKQYNNILIFEDDFSFIYHKEETYEVLNNAIKSLPQEWDILYLGANIMYEYTDKPMVFFEENLFKINSAYCMHSIAFSKKGISLFIETFPDIKIFAEKITNNYKILDVFMAKEFCMKNSCFITNKMLCTQSVGFSSIENLMTDYTELLNRYNRAVNRFSN